MKRNSFNFGIIIGLMIAFMMIGFIAGMLVIHITNKNKNGSLSEIKQPKIETVHTEEITNFYYPKREFLPGQIPRSSYNPDGFRIDNGFMAYFDDEGNKISHLGIDVSYHQQEINWDELTKSPIEFIMIRCGYRGHSEGGLIEDEKFREYAEKANEYGINMGVYFFTQAINEEEALAEADYVINLLDGYDLSYPVAFDTEYVSEPNARTNVAEISPELRSKICIAFCERIKEAGYFPIIYASENWMRRQLDLTMLTDYDFWAPQYLDKNDFLFDFTIWQYTEKGSIPGIKGDVDLDISMVDYSEFVPGLMQATKTEGEIGIY